MSWTTIGDYSREALGAKKKRPMGPSEPDLPDLRAYRRLALRLVCRK